jgi:ABC-type phosphate transport system substrate-binding protein
MKRLACLLFLLSASAWADVESIINTSIPVREITRAEARDIYLLKERFGPLGARPQVFRMPLRSKTHGEFVRQVLNMSASAFDKEWLKLVNAGLATEIEEVATEREMLATVSRRPRGVGYLSKDYLVMNIKGTDAEILRIVP